ncbi:DISARM system helicase DrmA [Rosistilla oblonga]|uniref:DISARM system helicase DrmA n=1 Tax=Rosistilla oblonga TaxID=2527990 RepID=UPI003A97BAA5
MDCETSRELVNTSIINSINAKSTSVDVRKSLVEVLDLDLIGPTNDHAFARELLPETPLRWYLTGFLVPTDAPLEQKFDESSIEEIDSAETGGADDDTEADKPAAKRNYRASSMGLSVLVPASTTQIKATIEWGEYLYEGPGDEHAGDTEPLIPVAASKAVAEATGPDFGEEALETSAKSRPCWRRSPLTREMTIDLPSVETKPPLLDVPNSGGLKVMVTVRDAESSGMPANTKSVAVFLVNARQPDPLHAYRAFIFQVRITLHCQEGFVPRPDPRSWTSEDEWDEQVNDLHYHDTYEFAVGHGVSAHAVGQEGDRCFQVQTVWLPQAEVERVAPKEESELPGLVLAMEDLGALTDSTDVKQKLGPVVTHYRDWIAKERTRVSASGLSSERKDTAKGMLADAESAASRIEAGIECLASDAVVLDAFKIANRAMAKQARQRFWIGGGKVGSPEQMKPPKWRPFQLAYLLMTIRGIAQPQHADRDEVDLLFFPTGGGKTEAYFGLAAFTIVLRRLNHPGVRSAGVTVLMRYTLRLLTLDQLGRAAALVCALELERKSLGDGRLGDWPFEIGLWVGQAATPNRMGGRGQKDPKNVTAYSKTRRFRNSRGRDAAPIPIEDCPWCGTKFTGNSFRLEPSEKNPLDLRVHCVDENCDFCGDNHLPILGVDEPIYRRLPCFMIATIDKFAALPWTGETGALFGKVQRHDKNGFYGPCCDMGTPIPGGNLPPPELIIQDELHLISGPLGTIAGLYETTIDSLSSYSVGESIVRPKIIASTATVRRADKQINALFGRKRVSVFPPPGPNRKDSFFAETKTPDGSAGSNARLYLGIAAQGRSLKVVLLRTALSIMSAGYYAWSKAGGDKVPRNPADTYMTLLGYFNSLRELGGSRRIVEDEIRSRLSEYGKRQRLEPKERLFYDRNIAFEPVELTSRVSTNAVAEAKRRLSIEKGNDDSVDVALATNMISVGLDIIRLGLMVVLGQPKTSSEYIQATSRVGRDVDRPGLVLTLLNIHKPRDRSHYERFNAYHSSFYRNVEATSVTPFSPRALDRALAPAIVAMCRQAREDMTPAVGASQILRIRSELEKYADLFAERAREHNVDLPVADRKLIADHVKNLCNELMDDWMKIAQLARDEGSSIQYQREETTPNRRLLYEFLHPDVPNLAEIQKQFRANRSMRDVEPVVEVFVQELHEWEDR